MLDYAEEEFQKFYNGKHKGTWKCQCDCGNICYVTSDNLKRGDTPSCGCITKEKNNYAWKNNFILIRIPYTHYNNLCLEDLLENSTFIKEKKRYVG